MSLSRRGFIAGLLASAAVGPLAARAGFSELTAPLPAGAAAGWYDVFAYNEGDVIKLATAPGGFVQYAACRKWSYLGSVVPGWVERDLQAA